MLEKLVGLLMSAAVVVVVVVVVVELFALVETVVSRFGSDVVRPLSFLFVLLFVFVVVVVGPVAVVGVPVVGLTPSLKHTHTQKFKLLIQNMN